MIQRTVSGNVIDPKAKAAPKRPELRRWEARDEWGQPVVSCGSPDDEFPIWKMFKAIDGTAAAELAVAYLVDRYQVEGSTYVEVRVLPNGDWVRVDVHVEFSIEVEISARGVAPARRPEKLRPARTTHQPLRGE